jgi:hypothetical protein
MVVPERGAPMTNIGRSNRWLAAIPRARRSVPFMLNRLKAFTTRHEIPQGSSRRNQERDNCCLLLRSSLLISAFHPQATASDRHRSALPPARQNLPHWTASPETLWNSSL